MPSIKAIKTRISSVQETRKITNAMYVISTIKMRKEKEELDLCRPFFEAIKKEISRAFNYIDELDNKYLKGNKGNNGYLVITADKGLCGGYNKSVIEKANELITDNDNVYMIGEYGRRNFQSHNKTIEKTFNYTAQNPSFARAKIIADEFVKLFNDGVLNNIYVVYTDMKNSVYQEVKVEKILPLDKSSFVPNEESTHFEVEPSIDEVINNIVPVYLTGYIYGILVDSFCSEQSARMMAMDYANKNADKLMDELKLKYNNLRQGAITQEITEVSAGVKSYKSNK